MDSRTNERNDLQEIIDKALAEMAEEKGGTLDSGDVNLAEFERRTGLTRSKARTLKSKGFRVTAHGRYGMKAATGCRNLDLVGITMRILTSPPVKY
jgi:hypothetical protein